MVHKTNMLVQMLSHLQMVSNLRVYFKPCTTIFPRSLRDIWNLQNLQKIDGNQRGQDFKECKNTLVFYVVPYLMCYGKI
jgi:hypothetical protein